MKKNLVFMIIGALAMLGGSIFTLLLLKKKFSNRDDDYDELEYDFDEDDFIEYDGDVDISVAADETDDLFTIDGANKNLY